MRSIIALTLLVVAPLVMAQAPSPDADAKAQAEQVAAKKAWQTKLTAFQLCEAQNVVAANFRANAQAAGKPVNPPVPTPECEDPGAFGDNAKPREASGAHSPADTADTPPSQRETEASINKGMERTPDQPTGATTAPSGSQPQ